MESLRVLTGVQKLKGQRKRPFLALLWIGRSRQLRLQEFHTFVAQENGVHGVDLLGQFLESFCHADCSWTTWIARCLLSKSGWPPTQHLKQTKQDPHPAKARSHSVSVHAQQ